MTAVDGVSSTTSSTSDALFGCDQAQVYMDANAVALSQEITMGGGQTVTDLAGMAGIEPEDRAAFAKVLRAQHAALVPRTRSRARTPRRSRASSQTRCAKTSSSPSTSPPHNANASVSERV